MTSQKQIEDEVTFIKHPKWGRLHVAMSATIFLLAAIGVALLSSHHQKPENVAIVEMLRWLEANGAEVDGIEVTDDGFGGRDVRSTRPIKEGETLVSLPRSLLLTRDVYENDDTVKAVRELAPEMASTEIVAVFLMANKKDSFWTPFFNILPESIPLPIFWSDDDLQWLQIPHFIQSVHERKEALGTMFESVVQVLTTVTLHEFMHAWALISSRAWGFTLDGKLQDVLVPLFDLANHEPTGILASLSDDESQALLIANRDHEFGAFIHTYYSNHSNFQFLQSYGFTLENNDRHMSCNIEDDTEIWHFTRDIGEGSEFQRFLEKHRAAAATEENNALDHEILALDQIFLSIESLSAVPTTLEDDDNFLKNASLSLNQRNAFRARRHEKLCWKLFKDLAVTVTEIMYHPTSWAWLEAKFGDWEGYDSYSQHLVNILS